MQNQPKPVFYSWEMQMLSLDGIKTKAIFVAKSMEHAHEMANELYPDASARTLRMIGEW